MIKRDKMGRFVSCKKATKKTVTKKAPIKKTATKKCCGKCKKSTAK